MMGRRPRDSGQMTVELVVVLPVLIVVAVIAINALQFISDCALFDRSAHDAVRIYGASPAYGQGVDQSCALIEEHLRTVFSNLDNIDIKVNHGITGVDYDEYKITLEFAPTLFGSELRSEVFGVSLPHLTHVTRYVVDEYKPGVVV